MTVAASRGAQTRFSMAAAGTAIASYAEAHEKGSESLKKTLTILDTSGIRGTRSHAVERTRDGTYTVGGSITWIGPGKAQLDLLLNRILGSGPAANVYSLADDLTFFDVLIDRIAKRFVYGNCLVDKAHFRARASGFLELTLDLIGQTETVAATAFPAISAPTDSPYVWSDCVVTLGGSARVVTEFDLLIDNHVTARFSNSQTATDSYPVDRTVTIMLKTPYTSDYTDLYGVNSGGASAASLVFTNGSNTLTFSIAALQIPDNSPTIQNKGEIFYVINGQCRKTGSTSEISITNA